MMGGVKPLTINLPDGLPVLGTVLAAKADCLGTGDNDLLVLSEFSGHPILSLREFWQRLK